MVVISSGNQNPSGAKAQNAEWLAADMIPISEIGGFIRVTLATVEAVVLQYTLDSGATWISLRSGASLIAGAIQPFDIPVEAGVQFNLRTPTAGGCTILQCNVKEHPVSIT